MDQAHSGEHANTLLSAALTPKRKPPAWVGKYIGRPYEPVVWDCYALMWTVLMTHAPMEMDLPRHDGTAALSLDARADAIRLAVMSSDWIEIKDGYEQLYDVALMKWRGHPVHVAPIVAMNTILNVDLFEATRLEELRVNWQPDRVVGVYRHRKLA